MDLLGVFRQLRMGFASDVVTSSLYDNDTNTDTRPSEQWADSSFYYLWQAQTQRAAYRAWGVVREMIHDRLQPAAGANPAARIPATARHFSLTKGGNAGPLNLDWHVDFAYTQNELPVSHRQAWRIRLEAKDTALSRRRSRVRIPYALPNMNARQGGEVYVKAEQAFARSPSQDRTTEGRSWIDRACAEPAEARTTYRLPRARYWPSGGKSVMDSGVLEIRSRLQEQ